MKLFYICTAFLLIVKMQSSDASPRNNMIKCNEFIMNNQFDENNGTKCTFSLISLESSIDSEITLLPPLRSPENLNFLVDHSNLIEIVEFIDCKFPQIPNKVLESFVNLKTLNADDVSLKSLENTQFRSCRKLASLSLMRNQLMSLGSSKFAENENLEFLDFSINKIDDIKRSSFSGLIRLKKLFLNENNISILPTQDVFDDLVALEEIGLTSNRIKSIKAELFSKCGNLSYIYLDQNDITDVHDDFLSSNTELHFIELSNNQLTRLNLSFHSSALYANHNQLKNVKLNSVGYVSLYNNSMHEIMFDDPEGVLSLNISTNNFTLESLGGVFNLNNMKSLDLSFNNLGRIETSTLLNLTSLQILNLQSTNISDIPYGLFTHQTSLEQLDISYCNLQRFDAGKLTSLKNLTTLFIEGNNISTSFDYSNLKIQMPSLKVFGFSDNLWPCSFLSSLIAHLNQLEIETFHLVADKTKSNVDGVVCVSASENESVVTSTNDGNKSSTVNPIIKHHQLASASDENELRAISDNFHRLLKASETFATRTELIAELSGLKSLLITMQQNINDIRNDSVTFSHVQPYAEQMRELHDKINIIESQLRMKSSGKVTETRSSGIDPANVDLIMKIMIIAIFSIACGFTFIYIRRALELKRTQSFVMRRTHSETETINENIL